MLHRLKLCMWRAQLSQVSDLLLGVSELGVLHDFLRDPLTTISHSRDVEVHCLVDFPLLCVRPTSGTT
jgi:hypothetical protein